MKHPTQLTAHESALMVIDVQEKLMAKIPGADTLTRNIAFLLDVAKLLKIEVVAPSSIEGVGPTVAPLSDCPCPENDF